MRYIKLHITFWLIFGLGVSIGQTTFDKVLNLSGNPFPVEVLPHPDGGFLILGNNLSGQAAFGILVSLWKVDSLGNLEWTRGFGNPLRPNFGFGMAYSPFDSSYIITGQTTLNNIYELYAIKVDLEGQLIWEKTFGDGLDQGCDLIVDQHGALILARDYIVSCNDSCNLDAINLIRINHQGDSLWSTHIGPAIDGRYNLGKILGLQTNQYLVAGVREIPPFGFPRDYERFVFLVDTLGTILDTLILDPTPRTTAGATHDLSFSDGKILSTFQSGLFYSDSLDNIVWDKRELVRTAVFTAEEDIATIMRSTNHSHNNPTSSLYKLNTQGDTLWEKEIGVISKATMISLPDGGMLIATEEYYTTNLRHLRLIRTDCEGNVQNPVACATTSTPAAQSPHITLYPNPSQGQLRLELPAALTRGQLRLYDATGRLLGQYPLEPGPQVLDLGQLPPGLLLYELEAGDYRQLGKVLLQR